MSRQSDRWRARKGDYGPTSIEQEVEKFRKAGTLQDALRNYSRHPKGRKRIKAPEYS